MIRSYVLNALIIAIGLVFLSAAAGMLNTMYHAYPPDRSGMFIGFALFFSVGLWCAYGGTRNIRRRFRAQNNEGSTQLSIRERIAAILCGAMILGTILLYVNFFLEPFGSGRAFIVFHFIALSLFFSGIVGAVILALIKVSRRSRA